MIKKIISILICLSLLSLTGCKNDEQVKKISEEDLNGKFFENQTMELLEIQNFSISSFDDSSYISFDVMNNGDSTYVNIIKILGYDVDNNLVMEVYGYVGQSLEKDSSKHIEIESDINLSSVSYVSYERM